MKEIGKQGIFVFVLIFVAAMICVVGSWALSKSMTSSALAATTNQNYHISDNLPVGTVVTVPEDLGGGIYLIQVQIDESNPECPTVYAAITAQPEHFSLNSKVKLKNVTASGKNASSDMFHVAIKP